MKTIWKFVIPSKAFLFFPITNDMAVTLSEKGHLRLLYIIH